MNATTDFTNNDFTNGVITVFSRMMPSTLVDFIVCMDNMRPEDYTDDDLLILHMAVTEFCAVVGVSDAIEMLSAADVNAENPFIAAAFEEASR